MGGLWHGLACDGGNGARGVKVASRPNLKKGEEEKDISKRRTGLYGDSEGEKERMEERNEDDENVRVVVVEHPKSRSHDQWSGYHLGPFQIPKTTARLFFSDRVSFSASSPTAKSTVGQVCISKVCP